METPAGLAALVAGVEAATQTLPVGREQQIKALTVALVMALLMVVLVVVVAVQVQLVLPHHFQMAVLAVLAFLHQSQGLLWNEQVVVVVELVAHLVEPHLVVAVLAVKMVGQEPMEP
jgi:hypothetical protein